MAKRMLLAATALTLTVVLVAGQANKERFSATDEQIEEVKTLLKAHDQAFTNHDLDGVLACYVAGPRTVVMGTGPGELWVGKEEISQMYQQMFKDFDKGKQNFNYYWRQGGVNGRTAWLNAMGDVKLTKDGEEKTFALNASCIIVRAGKSWKFVNFHFSTFGGPPKE